MNKDEYTCVYTLYAHIQWRELGGGWSRPPPSSKW